MSAHDQVVVQFRYHGGDYRLELDKSTAQRLAAAEKTFTVAPTPPRWRDRLRTWAYRASRA